MSKTLTLPDFTEALEKISQFEAYVAEIQANLCKQFAKLKEDGERLKKRIPTLTLPWTTYTPPVDQRHYQVKNCMDAILKVLPTKVKDAIPAGEIIRRIRELNLSYAFNSINQNLSNMKQFSYADNDGYKLQWGRASYDTRENHRGRPGFVFWKVKA